MQRATIATRTFSAAPAYGAVARRPMTALRATSTMADSLRQTVADNKVVVYSKTTCPYCSRVKALLKDLKVDASIIELDQTPDGPKWQDTLQEVVGRRSVPQVFIGGAHVGGCDDTMAAYQAGKLKELLAGVGYSI